MTDFNDGAKRGEDPTFKELGFTESQNGEEVRVHTLEDDTIQVEIIDSVDHEDGWYLSLTTDEASYLAGLLHGTSLKIVEGKRDK